MKLIAGNTLVFGLSTWDEDGTVGFVIGPAPPVQPDEKEELYQSCYWPIDAGPLELAEVLEHFATRLRRIAHAS